MRILSDIPYSLDRSALMARLRVRSGSRDEKSFAGLVDRVEAVARPKAMYDDLFVEERFEEGVRIGTVVFRSRMLQKNLEGVDRAFPYVVTCGRETDGVLGLEADFVEAYWLDGLKEVLLEAALAHLEAHLRSTFRLSRLITMNPGSGEESVWPIEQQRELFALLGEGPGHIGVELTPSYLMIPNKTVSGLLFPTERDFRTCQVCLREVCPNRMAEFDEALWESIQTTA